MIDLDQNYWRNIYKDKWGAGKDRVIFIQEQLLLSNKDLYFKDGFMCKSTQMLIETPKQHKRGSPDFSVWKNDKHLFNVEVTGSDIDIGNNDLWVRPDKANWSIENPDPVTWIFFVYNDKVFSLLLNSVAFNYPIETMNLKGVPESYYVIPQSKAREHSFVNGSEK